MPSADKVPEDDVEFNLESDGNDVYDDDGDKLEAESQINQ